MHHKKINPKDYKNYYIAIGCIVFIVIFTVLVVGAKSNTSRDDFSGQAYSTVAQTPEEAAQIMARQAATGRMQKVYTDMPITGYAYLRDD